MLGKNSGWLYELESSIIIRPCYTVSIDFTDEAFMSGKMMAALSFPAASLYAERGEIEFAASQLLFPPVPVFKFPSARDQEWKRKGRLSIPSDYMPTFKYTNGRTLDSDWSGFDWWRVKGFSGKFERVGSFDEVRGLETNVLYSLSDLKTRIEMMYLLSNGVGLDDYFDLSDERVRTVWIMLKNA